LALPESITATIIPADAAPSRMASLARRRPTLYTPLLALHRSPIDGNATKTQRTVALAAVQWPDGPSLLESVRPAEGELMVLPELSALPGGLRAEQYGHHSGGSVGRASCSRLDRLAYRVPSH